MTIYVVAVGRLRNAPLRDACESFVKRIRRYLKLEVKEVRDAGRREKDAALARRVEGRFLLDAVPPSARVIAVTRTGRTLSSEDFARNLETWRLESRDTALIIGGAHGLEPDLVRQADDCLSLSALTLPHELARVVLLEQLYRACTILRGEPYHKRGPQ